MAQISSGNYSESNKAKICLRDNIESSAADSIKSNQKIELVSNGKVKNNIGYSGEDICAYSNDAGNLYIENGADVGDIYLNRNNAITLNDPSFFPSENITVGIDTATDYYTAGREVLTGSAVCGVYHMFTLTNEGSLTIGSDGKLQ